MLMRLADPITLLLNCSLTLKDDLPCHWKEKNNSISSAWKKMFDVTVFWEIGKRNSSKSLMKDSGSSLKMSAAFTNPTSGKIDQQRKILEVRALATLSLGHTKWRHMVIIMVSFSYYPNVCGYRGCLPSIKPLVLGRNDNLSRFSGRQHKPLINTFWS